MSPDSTTLLLPGAKAQKTYRRADDLIGFVEAAPLATTPETSDETQRRGRGVRTNPMARAAVSATAAATRLERDLRPLPAATLFGTQDTHRRIEDRQFMEMTQAYGRHGGIASGDDIAWRMRRHCNQPTSVLAHWIISREVVSLTWRSRILVPVFQFDSADMHVRAVVCDVLAEFDDVFDDWEIAAWFAQPNGWLGGERPLELVEVDNDAIVLAARADRFIARG